MSDKTPRATWTSIYPWLVWGVAASFFFCDYFARVAPSVMVDDLMTSFHVTAQGLGSLSGYFYWPYIAMQIPVGLLVDKFGVRRLLIIMSLITAYACYLFGHATTLFGAELGRFLLGFGAAFAFVGALKLATVWFPVSRFGLLAGLTQALGMLGAAFGEAPVSYAVQTIGWRSTSYLMVGIFVLLAIGLYAIVQDNPPGHEPPPPKKGRGLMSMAHDLGVVLRNPQSWMNAIYAGLLFAPVAAFGELWGANYLQHVHGMSESTAAMANGMIFIGWGIGGPLIGWLSDYTQRRWPLMLGSAVMGLALLCILLFVPNLSATTIFIVLTLFGVSNTGVGLAYAVAAEINPLPVAGASIAFSNMMSILIGACFQPLIGHLMDIHAGFTEYMQSVHYSPADYHFAMLILPAALVACVAMMMFIRETYCQPQEYRHMS